LNKAGFGQASVSGTVSATEILLTVDNMLEIPGGTLDLHH
jgi:hypothetical protein